MTETNVGRHFTRRVLSVSSLVHVHLLIRRVEGLITQIATSHQGAFHMLWCQFLMLSLIYRQYIHWKALLSAWRWSEAQMHLNQNPNLTFSGGVHRCRRTCCSPPSSQPWIPWLRSTCSRTSGSTSRSTSLSSERVCSTTQSLWWVQGTFVRAAVADGYCCVDTSQKHTTVTLHRFKDDVQPSGMWIQGLFLFWYRFHPEKLYFFCLYV